MDRRMLDQKVEGLASGLRALHWEREPERALRTCVQDVGNVAQAAPPELHGYLVDRLDPVLSQYGLDAARLLRPREPAGRAAGDDGPSH